MGSGTSKDEEKKVDLPSSTALTDEEMQQRLNLTISKEDDDEVETADVVSELKGDRALEALKITESSVEDILQQIGIIIEIASKNRENKAMLRKRMAAGILLKVAKQHSSHLIIINCIKALNLVMDGSHVSKETEDLMGSSGIIEIMMDLFQNAPQNEDVIEHCCRLVRSITNVSENNSIRLGSLGCNELIIGALKNHPAHEIINTEGWNCLTNLCRNEEGNSTKTMADAIDLLVPTMVMHASNHSVVLACVRAVVNLSGPSALNTKLGEAGVCNAVVEAMRNTQSEVTRDVSVRAIINLSSDTANRKLLGEAGACEVLYESIKSFPGNVTIVHGASVACLSLSNVPANKQKLVALGLRAILEDIIKKTPPDGILFRLANLL